VQVNAAVAAAIGNAGVGGGAPTIAAQHDTLAAVGAVVEAAAKKGKPLDPAIIPALAASAAGAISALQAAAAGPGFAANHIAAHGNLVAAGVDAINQMLGGATANASAIAAANAIQGGTGVAA